MSKKILLRALMLWFLLTACAPPATAIPPRPTPSAPGAQPTVIPSPTPMPQPTITSANEAIALAQLQFPNLRDIRQTPPRTIGASTQITAKDAPDGWQLVFWKGDGDCMAGCINNYYWYVSVNRSGIATLTGEYAREYDAGANTFKIRGQPLWGVPQQ